MPGPSDATIEIACSPSLAAARSSLFASLGPGFALVKDVSSNTAVVVLGVPEVSEIVSMRQARAHIGIVVLFDRVDEPSTSELARILDSGADVCLGNHEWDGIAAHIRAIARRCTLNAIEASSPRLLDHRSWARRPRAPRTH